MNKWERKRERESNAHFIYWSSFVVDCLFQKIKQLYILPHFDSPYRLFYRTGLRYLCCKVYQDPPETKRLFDLRQYENNNDQLYVNHRQLPTLPCDLRRLNSVTLSSNFFYIGFLSVNKIVFSVYWAKIDQITVTRLDKKLTNYLFRDLQSLIINLLYKL